MIFLGKCLKLMTLSWPGHQWTGTTKPPRDQVVCCVECLSLVLSLCYLNRQSHPKTDCGRWADSIAGWAETAVCAYVNMLVGLRLLIRGRKVAEGDWEL